MIKPTVKSFLKGLAQIRHELMNEMTTAPVEN